MRQIVMCGFLFEKRTISTFIKETGLKRALDVLRSTYPNVAADVELVTFGSFKQIDSLRNFAIPHVHLGLLKGAEEIKKAYEECDIVVSTSDFETLPGTLIEGQAYGCIPVALNPVTPTKQTGAKHSFLLQFVFMEYVSFAFR